MSKIYLINTESKFILRYAIEADSYTEAQKIFEEHQPDDVSQTWLGDNITNIREVSVDEYLESFNKHNDYLRTWTDEQKMKLVYMPITKA